MGQIKYPQEKTIEGPWLLNQESFEELNEIVKYIDESLRKTWKQSIKDSVYQENEGNELSEDEIIEKIELSENSYSNKRHEIVCEISSSNGNRLVDDSVIGLLRDSSLKDFSPTLVNIRVAHGSFRENDFELRIKTTYFGDLDYKIDCTDPVITSEIQYEIEKWIEKYQPKKVVSFWANQASFLTYVAFVPLVTFLIYAFSPEYTKYSEALSKEVQSIVSNGVDNSNIYRAVEILLESKYDYVPDDFKREIKDKDPIYFRSALLFLFLYVIAWIRPKTTIGLGKKKIIYSLYSKWIQIVTVTLPIALIVTPLWNNIVSWFYK